MAHDREEKYPGAKVLKEIPLRFIPCLVQHAQSKVLPPMWLYCLRHKRTTGAYQSPQRQDLYFQWRDDGTFLAESYLQGMRSYEGQLAGSAQPVWDARSSTCACVCKVGLAQHVFKEGRKKIEIPSATSEENRPPMDASSQVHSLTG